MPFLGKTPSQIVDPEVDIDGGTIDGVSIGSVTANAGAFTNLTATGTLTLPDDGISGDDVNGGTISNFASTGIDDNATSTAITIDASENFGIGTTSPDGSDWNASSKLLHLFQNDVNGVLLKLESSSTTGVLSAGNNQLQIGTLEAQPFKFYTSSTERMRIDSSGDVGIGTTSPSSALHVDSSNDGPIFDSGGTGNTNHALLVRDSANNQLLRVNNNGNVGIGTTNPLRSLQVGDNTSSEIISIQTGTTNNGSIYFGDNSATSAEYAGVLRYNHNDDSMQLWTTSTERMRIDSSGNVLVGRTATTNSSTNYGFNIYETGQIYVYSTSAGTDDVWRAYSQGTVTSAIDGNGTYQNLSDSKYKDNIAPTSVGLSEIQALNVVSFDWNTSGDHVIAGYVAQELMTVLPNLVSADDETGDLRVNHMGIIPVLTKAIQEQQAIIDDLQTRLSALEAN